MAALYEIVKEKSKKYKIMGILAKHQIGTSYSAGLPYIAKEHKVKPIIFYPSNGTIPAWLKDCKKETGVEIVLLHPNLITININQAKAIMEDRKGYFIPFGFDDEISVQVHAQRLKILDNIGTLIVPTMTGMVLAGAIRQVQEQNKNVRLILGFSCGRSAQNVLATVEKYLGAIGHSKSVEVRIINPYEKDFIPPEAEYYPFPVHPDYEKKAWHWMLKHMKELPRPIQFINIGR